jgi:hypothetical protein
VTDAGIGIAVEELGQLFEHVRRGSNAAGRAIEGIGLGLYICRGIVSAHGGQLWANSPGAGQGSTFHVVLPHAGLRRGRRERGDHRRQAKGAVERSVSGVAGDSGVGPGRARSPDRCHYDVLLGAMATSNPAAHPSRRRVRYAASSPRIWHGSMAASLPIYSWDSIDRFGLSGIG